jgi:hypothetical protein
VARSIRRHGVRYRKIIQVLRLGQEKSADQATKTAGEPSTGAACEQHPMLNAASLILPRRIETEHAPRLLMVF